MISTISQGNTVVTNMSSSSPAITNFAYWCSVSFTTVKVFVMLSWQPRLTHPKPITLDLASTLLRVLLQMPIPSATISPILVADLFHNMWHIELFFYDKHIIMQSRHQSNIDFQDVNHITSRFNFA